MKDIDMARARRRAVLWITTSVALAAVAGQLGAQQAPAPCRVSGRITSGTTPLPGVAVVASAGGRVMSATSTEADGTYQLAVAPGAYDVRAELTGFTALTREVTLTGDPCVPQVADVQLTLAPRRPRAAVAASAAGRPRFETLNVEAQHAATAVETPPAEREAIDAATRLLLPPGFSTEGPTESLAVAGNMADIDRRMMGDRMDAIGRGEFNPLTGEFAPGVEAGAQGPGGRGAGGPGGRGGRGNFAIAGRGGRQNTYNIQANYNYGGSALDSSPYRLRPDSPASTQSYNRQSFGVTVGGPVRLPGYNGQRRTTFAASYNGNRGDQLFDQYATVPTEAMRAGDFSSVASAVIDPATGRRRSRRTRSLRTG